ncbi:MAG: SurA N-terminal domain-containing protein [Acidobacteriota bacterium]|nr:MAG: SurA N-terminal domain-containing protein [Acidobacteriota bacterium]
MLRFFTKFQRSRNFLLLAFCGLLLIGLIAFYIPNTPLDPSGTFSSSAAEDDTVIAKVGSEEIKLKDYRLALANMASTFGRGNALPMSTLKALGMDKQVLDQLISNRLLLAKADELNLTGTDREVSDIIKRNFIDTEGRWVGAEEYKRRLKLQGQDVAEYEQDRRSEISARKMRNFMTAALQVSDREIEEKFKRDNTKIDVTYATIDLDKVREKYSPTDEDLKAWYESHKGEFKATEATRKVEYIFISTDDVAKIVPVTEEELKQEYENRKQVEFRVSIIKLDVLTTNDEGTVQAKINDLNRRVRGVEGGTPPEDFAVVAKGNSQDKSAAGGGDIGWIRKDANKSGDWRQRPYSNGLSVGAIDGPFRDGQSWYILKVTEQRDVPFAQMRETLKATLTNNKSFQYASQMADKAYEKATEFKDLRKAAEEIAKELKVNPATMVKTTPYFKNGDPLPDLGKGAGRASNPAFEEAVSTLKKGEIGDKVSIPGGQAVPRLVDIIENGQQLTFEQARNQVEDKLRQEKEPTLAQAKAREIAGKAANAAEFERLARAEGLEVKTDTNFNNYSFPGASAGGLQAGNQARTALYGLKEGEVARNPVKVGTSYLIFAATKRTEADLSKLPAERDSIRQILLNERQSTALEAYLKSVRSSFEKDGKIKIYQDRIDKFFAAADTPIPQ